MSSEREYLGGPETVLVEVGRRELRPVVLILAAAGCAALLIDVLLLGGFTFMLLLAIMLWVTALVVHVDADPPVPVLRLSADGLRLVDHVPIPAAKVGSVRLLARDEVVPGGTERYEYVVVSGTDCSRDPDLHNLDDDAVVDWIRVPIAARIPAAEDLQTRLRVVLPRVVVHDSR